MVVPNTVRFKFQFAGASGATTIHSIPPKYPKYVRLTSRVPTACGDKAVGSAEGVKGPEPGKPRAPPLRQAAILPRPQPRAPRRYLTVCARVYAGGPGARRVPTIPGRPG